MHRVALASALFAATLLASSCSSTTKNRALFEVYFEATTDDGIPLPGVEINGNGRQLGVTTDDGMLRAFLRANEGATLRTRATCPPGYREPEQLPPLTLRRFRAITIGGGDQLRVSIECRASERRVALIVNTDQRIDLPIIMDGKEVGFTNTEGVAHVALRMAPNTTFRVALDTSEHPRLRPKSPIATFTVGDADALVVFDQGFAEEVKPKKRRRRRPKKATPPQVDPRPKKLVAPKRSWRNVRR